MEPMKRLSEIAAQMAETTPEANTPTSSSPDSEAMQALSVTCYDPDYPDRPCPICKGMGVIKYAVEPDDPRFGKLFRCPNNPVEVDADRQARLRRLSNLNAFRDKTLENFRVDIPMYSTRELQSLDTAFKTALAYASNPVGWLLLQGTYGTGKTHLAAAIGNERLRYGDVVLFITTPDLLDYLRSTFAPDSDTGYDELFDRVRNASLLILDDMGTENPSAWAREKLFQILNHRYNHRMPTVITTNTDIDDLDPRIRSRLMDTSVISRVIINVPDFRNTTTNKYNKYEQEISRITHYTHMRFDTFDIHTRLSDEERENLAFAADVAFDFAQRASRVNAQWLLFMGGYGSGKTHLAASIANYRREQGEEVMFLTVPDLLDYFRTTFGPDSDITFDKLFEQVRNVSLLVLDDLGMESTKPWAQEKLFQILDYRYVGRKETVITTARKLDDLSERIVSRLIDQRICRNIAMNVPSYAKRMKRR